MDGQTKRQASKHDRRQALLDAQKEAREVDPRPSEEIVREMRGEWSDRDNGQSPQPEK